jgi:formylmethanofuran dehydrogenase subunit A
MTSPYDVSAEAQNVFLKSGKCLNSSSLATRNAKYIAVQGMGQMNTTPVAGNS